MGVRGERSKLVTALAAGGAVALLGVALQAAGAWRALELKAYDLRMKGTLPDRKPAHPDVVLLILSEESLEWAKAERERGWPWDRRLFAELFRACSHPDYPATAVLFDFFTFCDPDPHGGEADAVAALKESVPVYVSVPFKLDRVPRADARPGLDGLLDRYSIDVRSDGSVTLPESEYGSVLLPVPGVAEAVAGACDVMTREDTDGITRRYRIVSRFRGRFFPSFALAALMAREGTREVRIEAGAVKVGKASIPVEPDGTILLRYYRPGDSFVRKMAHLVIPGFEAFVKRGDAREFDPSTVSDRVVIVGTSAAALYDLKVTPVELMPGAEVHAVALANVLNGEMMRFAPAGAGFLLTAAAAVLTALVTRFTRPLAGGAVAALLFAGTGALGVALFRARWAVDLVAPLAAVGLAYGATSALNFLYEGRQRLRTKREFQRYLSPKVVEKILEHPDALRLEGERKVLSVFFLDFAGFTSMSEKLSPAELVKLMNEYHNEAAEEIFRTDGTIDKYIGDAIMAFWNDPIEQPDHAVRACLTAVAAQRRLRQMALQMKEGGLPELRARIGINTGPATVGNMGARNQVNYTVMGDEVNLASRLEGVNKEFGTDIIVSESTFQPARDRLEARELALIRVKGKKQPVRIYELLGLRGEVAAERLEAARRFEAVLAHFRAGRFDAALEGFRALAAAGDAAAEPYAELCERYRREPPPPGWDGGYQMQSK
jgi:adenylate cyclase